MGIPTVHGATLFESQPLTKEIATITITKIFEIAFILRDLGL
jgi:hypothetical protein